MPASTDAHGVNSFCGMIQYLSKFLPARTSDLQTHARAYWLEYNSFVECEEAFQKVKQKITDRLLAVYFDPNSELVPQADSSKDG